MDARDLAGIGNEAFSFVFFSYNGIDSVSHADRLRILNSAHRVLRLCGWFAFSSHNLDGPWRNSRLAWPKLGRSPKGNFMELKRFVQDLTYYRRHKDLESSRDGYALVNDCAHSFRC